VRIIVKLERQSVLLVQAIYWHSENRELRGNWEAHWRRKLEEVKDQGFGNLSKESRSGELC